MFIVLAYNPSHFLTKHRNEFWDPTCSYFWPGNALTLTLPIYLKYIYIWHKFWHNYKQPSSPPGIRYVSLKTDLPTLSKKFSFFLCLPRDKFWAIQLAIKNVTPSEANSKPYFYYSTISHAKITNTPCLRR